MSGESVRQRARDDEDWKAILHKYSAALQAYASADAGSEAERIADAESDRLEAELVRVLSESSLARKQEREAIAKIVKSFQCSELENRKDVRPLIEQIIKAIHERGRKVEG